MGRSRAAVAGAWLALGLVLLAPGPAAADHVSTGTVVWMGDSEVVLLADDHYHVLTLTPDTLTVDEFGQSLRVLGIGDRVRERCRPAPEGGFTAVRIEILRQAWPRGEAARVL